MGRRRREAVCDGVAFGARAESSVGAAEYGRRLTGDFSRVLVGRFGAPFGVRGWLRVVSFGGDSFLRIEEWWCAPRGCDLSSSSSWASMRVEGARTLRGGLFAVKLRDVDSREDAARWTNGGIAVLRGSLPPLAAEGEHYWCDLIGLRAVDMDGEALGEVRGLFRTAAHDVLRIAPVDGGAEILAPFVDDYVIETDCAAGEIRLHWRREWR